MATPILPDPELLTSVRDAIKTHGVYGSAKIAGVHHNTIAKVVAGKPVAPSTVRALQTFRGGKVRHASDFTFRHVPRPRQRQPVHAWSLEKIRAARDEQMRGRFELPARLAEAMRLDDCLFTAYQNRIAPQSSIAAVLQPAAGERGKAVAKKAATSIVSPRAVLAGIHGTLANHCVAIGQVEHLPADDGTIVNMQLSEWPIEFVRWDYTLRSYVTKTLDGPEVPITHGDGNWVVFSKFDLEPWKQEACILPGALIFAAHIDGVRDWSAASRSHGMSKIIGELPEGVSLQAADEGTLSPEAQAFLDMLIDVVSGEAGAGLQPFGAKTQFLANSSTAWQVFKELLLNREKAAARVYLGTDGTLGSVGGAPGVDIAQLFGVASTKVQGDLAAIEAGLYSGLYVPWAAINFGNSKLAPRLEYQMPDPDKEKRRTEKRTASDALIETIKGYRSLGLVVDQSVINRLAADYDTEPPLLAETEQASISLTLAPTDVGKVVRGREARASQGLPPFGDYRDDLTLTELDADAAAKASQPQQGAPSNNTPPPPDGGQPTA